MDEKYITLDFNENYAVSNLGNVINKKTNKVLKQDSSTGYYQLTLCYKGRKKSYRVHRLVAYAFIKNELNKPYVNHKDGNKLNNHVDNLEWVTAKENDNHARVNLLKNENKQIKSINSKTGEVKNFISISECSRYYGINKAQIHRALNNTYNRKEFNGMEFKYI